MKGHSMRREGLRPAACTGAPPIAPARLGHAGLGGRQLGSRHALQKLHFARQLALHVLGRRGAVARRRRGLGGRLLVALRLEAAGGHRGRAVPVACAAARPQTASESLQRACATAAAAAAACDGPPLRRLGPRAAGTSRGLALAALWGQCAHLQQPPLRLGAELGAHHACWARGTGATVQMGGAGCGQWAAPNRWPSPGASPPHAPGRSRARVPRSSWRLAPGTGLCAATHQADLGFSSTLPLHKRAEPCVTGQALPPVRERAFPGP